MISFLAPLPIGNAVRCLLAPDEAAERTRVLRKLSDDISGETDPDAAIVFEDTEHYFVDTTSLVNGTTYFYRAFDLIGSSWVGSDSHPVIPAATANLRGPDVLSLMRLRLLAGLKAEVVAGNLTHETGAVPVLTAPPTYENTKWPVVSVHFQTEVPQVRALGEIIAGDLFDADDDVWIDSEGWYAGTQLKIVGWSLNSDERIALRLALKKVIIGNFPVFADAGMIEIQPSFNDVDDMESYAAPVFSTVCDFSCQAPSVVDATTAPIVDVTVSATTP